MEWTNMLGGLLQQYSQGQGATNRQQASEDYDQIAGAVPPDMLGSLIGPALSSLGSQQVTERVFNSASVMDPTQRGGLVGSLLQGFLNNGADIGSLLGALGVNPAVAQDPSQATPEEVAALATHAHDSEPGIFDKAMGFYAEHPTLVKVLGTLAVAAIARNLSERAAEKN